MRIIGHGVDLEQVSRIKDEMDSLGSNWVDRVYSAEEREQADPKPVHYRYFAGRYAGKEAVAKALGTGFADDVTWRGIEILRAESGQPYVRLSDEVLTYARNLGVTDWAISISYSDQMVIASAIATSDKQATTDFHSGSSTPKNTPK